jgi:hypothetical protein
VNTDHHELVVDFTKAREELSTLRDEIRVRLHLAKMEARDEWNDVLEPRLHEVEAYALDIGEKARLAARELLNDLREFYGKLT